MREPLVLTTFSVEHSFYHLYWIRSSSVLGVSLMFPRGWQWPYRSRKLILSRNVEHTFKRFSSSEGLTSSTVLSTRTPPIIRKHFLVGSTFLKASSTSLRSWKLCWTDLHTDVPSLLVGVRLSYLWAPFPVGLTWIYWRKNFAMLLLLAIVILQGANAMFFPLYAVSKRMYKNTWTRYFHIAQCFETVRVTAGDLITGSFEISGTQEGMQYSLFERIHPF
jgi:hypothetical protein